MKATSHFAMAHIINAALKQRGIYLDRIAFVYGNIEPDYTPVMWVNPHFNKVCLRTISNNFLELPKVPVCSSGLVGAYYSKRLGMMCHFLCDYFCYAHNDSFSGNISQHISYENELDLFLRSNCLELLDIDEAIEIQPLAGISELFYSLETSHEKYLKAGFSLQNDLCSAFEACISSIVNILALSKRVQAAATSIQLEDFIASLKGYATGNSVVFRMFMFKYRNANLFFLPELMPPIGIYA